MNDCRVYRRVLPNARSWVVGPAVRNPRPIAEWYGVCADCGEVVRPGRGYPYAVTTRKNAKDALFRHARDRHAPGLTGRGRNQRSPAASGTYGSA
jgi:hypothetical protein